VKILIELVDDNGNGLWKSGLPLEDQHYLDWYGLPVSYIIYKGRLIEHIRVTLAVHSTPIPEPAPADEEC
jgi:hypothetical protein